MDHTHEHDPDDEEPHGDGPRTEVEESRDQNINKQHLSCQQQYKRNTSEDIISQTLNANRIGCSTLEASKNKNSSSESSSVVSSHSSCDISFGARLSSLCESLWEDKSTSAYACVGSLEDNSYSSLNSSQENNRNRCENLCGSSYGISTEEPDNETTTAADSEEASYRSPKKCSRIAGSNAYTASLKGNCRSDSYVCSTDVVYSQTDTDSLKGKCSSSYYDSENESFVGMRKNTSNMHKFKLNHSADDHGANEHVHILENSSQSTGKSYHGNVRKQADVHHGRKQNKHRVTQKEHVPKKEEALENSSYKSVSDTAESVISSSSEISSSGTRDKGSFSRDTEGTCLPNPNHSKRSTTHFLESWVTSRRIQMSRILPSKPCILGKAELQYAKKDGKFVLLCAGDYAKLYLALMKMHGRTSHVAIKLYNVKLTTLHDLMKEASILTCLNDSGCTAKLHGIIRMTASSEFLPFAIVTEFVGDSPLDGYVILESLIREEEHRLKTGKKRVHPHPSDWMRLVQKLVHRMSTVHSKDIIINGIQTTTIVVRTEVRGKLHPYFMDMSQARYRDRQIVYTNLETMTLEQFVKCYPYIAPEIPKTAICSEVSDMYSLGYLIQQVNERCLLHRLNGVTYWANHWCPEQRPSAMELARKLRVWGFEEVSDEIKKAMLKDRAYLQMLNNTNKRQENQH